MTSSVEVHNVSKRFLISRQRPTDLREKVMQRFQRRADGGADFWALKDVSFRVEPGMSLGIVGHNGSGKSTMLKLLTGIMKPTSGSIRTRGRVGALIEVGAGFHPDLTGRENVFLNGSILGLSRREITRKFDEIVAFAGLEQFIDTPVKRYSSGMYMRLGFSIAAHIDPDILLIDEVLAVGDEQFQRKCLRRMKEFARQGGTIVFVSHSMAQVADLCQECVWLDHGQVLYQGETHEAVDRYMNLVAEREEAEFKRLYPEEWAIREAERERDEAEQREREEAERREREAAEREAQERLARRRSDPTQPALLGVTLRDGKGVARTTFRSGEPMRVEIAYRFGRPLPNPIFGVDIYRGDGLHVFTTSNYDHDLPLIHLPLSGIVAFDVPFLSLNKGTYRIQVHLFADSALPDWNLHPKDYIEEALVFCVTQDGPGHGCVYLPVMWDASTANSPSALTYVAEDLSDRIPLVSDPVPSIR